MSEATGVENPTTETPAAEATPAEQASTEVTPDQALIVENQKYRKRAQEAEASLAKLNADSETVRQARLKEEGRLAELNTEHEATIETLTAENAAFTEKFKVIAEAEAKEVEDLLGTLPEEKRVLYAGVSLPNLRQLVADATGTPPPGTDSRHPGGGKGEPAAFPANGTDAEQKAWLEGATRRATQH